MTILTRINDDLSHDYTFRSGLRMAGQVTFCQSLDVVIGRLAGP